MIYRISVFVALFVCLFSLLVVPLSGVLALTWQLPGLAAVLGGLLSAAWAFLSLMLALAFSRVLFEGRTR